MAQAKESKCLSDPRVEELADMLRIVSDANRLRIICILAKGEKCVCEVEEEMAISQPLTSHHLGVLKNAGLLNVHKEGTWSYYSVNREKLKRLNQVFQEHLGYKKIEIRKRESKVC